ncbi:hypothetical protein [Paenibacillus sp. FSL P4-0502]|uniref:hypothetical protein n=1 Tax=Paenibacillus sp. FSL P4-0502 TaxID=2975319 RepID=UPI0030FC92D1
MFKLNVSRLKDINNNWNLNLTINQARVNSELITVAESQAIRFIDQYHQYETEVGKINKLKKNIKRMKNNIEVLKEESSRQNYKNKYSALTQQLYELTFIKEFICLTFDNERTIDKDFERANEGFFINSIRYERLLAIPGQARQNTVIYVSSEIKKYILNKINNGRNIDTKILAGKLEAYMSLVFSSSIPVSDPCGVVVVDDCVTHFKEDVILIDDSVDGEPVVDFVDDYSIELNDSDGYGLILPSLAAKWANDLELKYTPSAFVVRNAFCKGLLVVFDFHKFANTVAKDKSKYIIDVWGNSKDNNILDKEIVLTKSMLKLWKAYDSYKNYNDNCMSNGYNFSVTKAAPEKLDDERTTNYQFIQSLELNDNDIEELIKPTVDEFKDVINGDLAKTLLFLKGLEMDSEMFKTSVNDFSKALMIEPKLFNDVFINRKIKNLIKEQINEAKLGDIRVNGNYAFISGDPFILAESMFRMDEVKGLLKNGEFYSKYWNDKNADKVVGFRAPMTCEENVRMLNLKNNEEMKEWYKHLGTVTIFNAWDTTANALNGADKDGDTLFTTNNRVLLNNTKELRTIICIQNTPPEPNIITEEILAQADRNSFGDAIGKVTNRVTAMIDLRSTFPKDSLEYEILTMRIMCGQNYQQNTIDKSKGIQSKDMPKEWYDSRSNSINYEDKYDKKGILIAEKDSPDVVAKKKYAKKITASKKPYFLIYRYDELKIDWKKYYESLNRNCIRYFGIEYKKLEIKLDKSDEEIKFIEDVKKYSPCSLADSVMNKICWKIESKLDEVIHRAPSESFEYSELGTNKHIKDADVFEIYKLYEIYTASTKDYMTRKKIMKFNNESDDSYYDEKKIFRELFKDEAYKINNNAEDLCNIIIKLIESGQKYGKNVSKSFLWDICGEQIIKNLLNKSNNIIRYPIADASGEVSYKGRTFKMITQKVDGETKNEG